MADLVKYPAEVLHAVYKTHQHADLEKLVSRIEQGQRRFYGENVVLAVTLDLWDKERHRVRLYQQERQVLRAIYVLAHQQNSIIVEFTPAQLMEVLGYAEVHGNDFSPTQRQQVLRALNNLFQIHVEVEMQLGSGGTKKIYGHFLDSGARDKRNPDLRRRRRRLRNQGAERSGVRRSRISASLSSYAERSGA